MSSENETRVFYRAVANFADIRKELASYRRSLAATKTAEQAFNAAGAKDRAAATKAATARSKALTAESNALKSASARAKTYTAAVVASTVAVRASTKAIQAQNRALLTNALRYTAAAEAAKEYSKAQRKISDSAGLNTTTTKYLLKERTALQEAVKSHEEEIRVLKSEAQATREATKAKVEFVEGVGKVNRATGEVVEESKKLTRETSKLGSAWNRLRRPFVTFEGDGKRVTKAMRQIEVGSTRLYRGLQKFGNWRPRLVPPFVALVPLIGAVIAALNPLVALIGTLSPLVVGLAGNIGSLSGAFLALPGILSGVVAGIAGVIASMGGVGNVFKTYSAMQKATSGGGKTQAERAESLADAEFELARAQKNVTKAQVNLNKAREEALQDLIDLRVEVSRAGLNEERAIANLRQAQEAYWNVMADPGSTLGDKLDAAASIKEAEADLQDVRQKNIENQKALNEAEAKGIENSDKVLDAQENLTDAYRAQTKAQRALNDEQAGGSGSVQAINDYNDALNKLSPSAQKFVLAILGMKTQWEDFRKTIQEDFFSQFVDDLERLPRLVQTLASFLRPAAVAMGQFASSFLEMMDSPAWKRDMSTIGEQNGSVIRNLGDGFLALTTALKDVVIAAGPFTEWMTNGFARGSENFAEFIANARETGSLANWLSKVEVRLRKWWDILKNIGATLFNYSAAASDFGDWLSDGFLKTTENWKKASEAARAEDSPFQQYLNSDELRGLLQEVKGLFGDFFGWLRREMMDPENLTSAQNLVKLFREDLGPALARLMDALSATNIDEKLVEAVTSIVDSLATLIENGGGKAFESFFDFVTGAFSALADSLKAIPKPILEGLLSLFGTLAAISFVGKFTGLTSLLGTLLGLGPNASLLGTMFTKMKGLSVLGNLKFLGLIGVLTALVAVTPSVVENVVNGLKEIQDLQDKEYPDTPKGNRDFQEDQAKSFGGSDITAGILEGLGFKEAADQLRAWQDDFNIGFTDAFRNTFQVIGENWNNFWGGLGTGWTDFWTGFSTSWNESWAVIGTNWNDFWGGIKSGWNDFWGGISQGWNSFWGGFKKNWDTSWGAIKTNWDGFWGEIKTNWDNLWSGISTNFNTVVSGIGSAWEGIKQKFAGPVNFVIDTVYNNGIVGFWNTIADKLGFTKLAKASLITVPGNGGTGWGVGGNRAAFADGGVLPGYTPGRDVHNFTSPSGGKLALSGGEAIMRPEWTKMVGGPKAVEKMNSDARKHKFASGGVWSISGGGGSSRKASSSKTVGRSTSPAKRSAQNPISDFFSNFFGNPVKYVTDGLQNLVNPLLGAITGSEYGKMIAGIPGAIISNLANKAGALAASSQPNATPQGKNGMGWQAQWAAIRAAMPGVQMYSNYRPNDPYSRMHSAGRAIDLTPSAAVFEWIRKNYPNSQALIYSPMGGRQLYNGRNYLWGEPEKSMHYNHVHWAMKNGGVLPGLYDNGGWLQPGQMGINLTGKPEAVLDPTESRALKALLSGNGLPALAALGANPGVNVPGSTQRVVDNSVNIGEYKVVNPVPETASESLPKAIRKVGYINSARSGD